MTDLEKLKFSIHVILFENILKTVKKIVQIDLSMYMLTIMSNSNVTYVFNDNFCLF